MRGRKPLPTALHKLAGNPGKRKPSATEPKPAVRLPSAPSQLGAAGRAEWKRVGKSLLQLGLVSDLDRAALVGYCMAWERALDAQEILKREGLTIETSNGNVIQHPALGIYNRAMHQLREFAVEFGMTPAARRRVDAVPLSPSAREQEPESAEAFLFGAPSLKLVKRA